MKLYSEENNPIQETYADEKGQLKISKWHVLFPIIKIIGYVIMLFASFSNPTLFIFFIGFILVRFINNIMDTNDAKHLDKAFGNVGKDLAKIEDKLDGFEAAIKTNKGIANTIKRINIDKKEIPELVRLRFEGKLTEKEFQAKYHDLLDKFYGIKTNL